MKSVLCLGAAASAAAGAAVAGAEGPDPQVALFGGARLGISKAELEKLAIFEGRGAGCGRIVLPDRPRTYVESCAGQGGDLSPSDGLRLHYVLAADQEGVLRVIHISVTGGPETADFAIDNLFRRFGGPAVVNNVRTPESIDRTLPRIGMGWVFGAQRLEFRRPCGGEGNYCVEWSDRPYGRQIARSVNADRGR